MTDSPLALVLAAESSLKWIDVAVLALFALGLVLVVLVPFTIDVLASHKTYRAMYQAAPAAARAQGPQGVQGLARATMAFAVIVVIGFALAYVLVRRPFADNTMVTSNILVALTTTLASITAFYFGSRLASQAHRDATAAVAAGAEDAAATGAAAAGSAARAATTALSIAITTPPDGAVYNQNDAVVADYTCTPSTGAQLTACSGPVAAGSLVDTSQPGHYGFTVQATDSAGQTTQVTHTYSVQ